MRLPLLTHDLVHQIRTSGLPDSHWEQLLGVTRTCVQKARVGVTWTTHPTPPDTAARSTSNGKGGRPQEDRLPQMTPAESRVNQLLMRWPRAECSTLETESTEAGKIS